MSIEAIGIVAFAAGLASFLLGQRALATALVSISLLGSAAALISGGNNITPAHLLVGFALLSMVTRPQQLGELMAELAPPRPAFWLLCFVVYGVLSSFLAPRLLAGTTEIIPLGTSAYRAYDGTVPLGPVSSNLTQSIYMISNLICLLLFLAVGSTRDGFRSLTAAIITFGILNIGFALIDVATFSAGLQDILSFIRNAEYQLHHEERIFGLKRIVGSFTEAAAFARATMGVFAFTATLWLCGRQSLLTGVIAAVSLLLLLFSTSSSGLAILPFMLGLLFLTALRIAVFNHSARASSAIVVAGVPALLLIAVVLIALNKEASSLVRSYVDLLLLTKLSSLSGIERSNWNTVAFQNVLDTWGLGVGLGTNRASSFALALLSNLGVVGVLLYGAFAFTAFLRIRETPGSYVADVKLAAQNACLGLIAVDLLISPVVDQGVFFYALAGLAASRPDARAIPKTRRLQISPAVRVGPAI